MIFDEPLITSTLVLGLIVFACAFGGALLGLRLRAVLPEHHLSTDSKDIVKLGIGLIATMSARVVSLLLASAKTSYDVQRSDLIQMSANVIVLDRLMAHYGPETRQAREQVRNSVGQALERLWPTDHARPTQLAPKTDSERFYDEIQALAPRDEAQRSSQGGSAAARSRDRARPVVASRAEGRLDPAPVPGRADLLARDDLHELRNLRTGQRDRHRDDARLRIVDFRRDLPGPGAGHAVRRTHSHF